MGVPATSVLVKVLRTGELCSAFLRGSKGMLLELEIGGNVAQTRGELLELRADGALYLGELKSRDGNNATVYCEHFIDLKVLEEIRNRWSLPEDADCSSIEDS